MSETDFEPLHFIEFKILKIGYRGKRREWKGRIEEELSFSFQRTAVLTPKCGSRDGVFGHNADLRPGYAIN
jgi:hypothetical protein